MNAPANGQIDAVAELPSEEARRVAVGMTARVSAFGAERSLDGVDAQVARAAAASNSANGADRALIVVGLPDAASTLHDGDACDLRIVTSRDAPISLIASAAPSLPGGRE